MPLRNFAPHSICALLCIGAVLQVEGCSSSSQRPYSGDSDSVASGTRPQERTSPTGGDNGPNPSIVARTSAVSVTVKDKTGKPIPDATVTVGGVSARSNSLGTATFADLPAGRQVFLVHAEGFAKKSMDLLLYSRASSNLTMTLARYTMTKTFEASTGISFDEGRVHLQIPANSIVNSSKVLATGPVVLRIAPMDPKDPADLNAAPALTASVPSSMLTPGSGDALVDTPLKSVFMADIALVQGAEELNLAPDKKALLAFDLPDSGDRWDGLEWDRIPSWYFDLSMARWRYEGMGIVKMVTAPGTSGPVTTKRWEISLSHFSPHNGDWYRANCPAPSGSPMEADCTAGGYPPPPPPPPPILEGCAIVPMAWPEGTAPAGIVTTASSSLRTDTYTTNTSGEACVTLYWVQGTVNPHGISATFVGDTRSVVVTPQSQGSCGNPSTCIRTTAFEFGLRD